MRQLITFKYLKLRPWALKIIFRNSSVASPVKTINDVKNNVSEMMGVSKGFIAVPPNRAPLLGYLPKSQEELPSRTMKDSFDSAIIPLSKDIQLQEKYMTLRGNVRRGRLLEDMDIFAVWICMKYIDNPKQDPKLPHPYCIVTARVEQVTFAEWPCKVTNDLRISGEIQMVGKSSMDVFVWMDTFVDGQWKLFTTSHFIMVARNSTNNASAFVNKLQPTGDGEKQKLVDALTRAKIRKKSMSLFKQLPETEEQLLVHDIFMKTVDPNDAQVRILPKNAIWMDSTTVSNIVYPHPEDRNRHNTVFGGHLMRLSSELSWIVAFTYGKVKPVLRQISDVTFESPVSINSFVRMTGHVSFTESRYALIVVNCEIMDVLSSQLFNTNRFHYTYEYAQDVVQVLPQSYLEAMLWIDGRRHYNKSIKSLT